MCGSLPHQDDVPGGGGSPAGSTRFTAHVLGSTIHFPSNDRTIEHQLIVSLASAKLKYPHTLEKDLGEAVFVPVLYLDPSSPAGLVEGR